MNKFISYQESSIIFNSLGEVCVVKDFNCISVELPINEDEKSLTCSNSIPNLNNELTFLNPSSKFQLAKRSAIELKLRWKTIRGINFSKRFYVNRFRFYKKYLLTMLKSYKVFINLFCLSIEVNFSHIVSFGFEFKCLEIVFNYSGRNFRIVYSSLIICFKFLFLESILLNEFSIFPNQYVGKSFNSLKEFDSFTHLNNLSFTKLGAIIERVSGVDGDLGLRSLYGGKLTKLEYRLESLFREGVKCQVNRFYFFKGVIDKFSSRPVFNEFNLYSCYSESYYYNAVPYRHVLSFNTGGRMSKYCKTFKKCKK